LTLTKENFNADYDRKKKTNLEYIDKKHLVNDASYSPDKQLVQNMPKEGKETQQE
jgi:hypothetical protein